MPQKKPSPGEPSKTSSISRPPLRSAAENSTPPPRRPWQMPRPSSPDPALKGTGAVPSPQRIPLPTILKPPPAISAARTLGPPARRRMEDFPGSHQNRSCRPPPTSHHKSRTHCLHLRQTPAPPHPVPGCRRRHHPAQPCTHRSSKFMCVLSSAASPGSFRDSRPISMNPLDPMGIAVGCG